MHVSTPPDTLYVGVMLTGRSEDKESACNEETRVRSLGQEDPLEKGMTNPLQYSCAGNPMDGGAQPATVHGVAKSWTRLSD